MNTKNLFIADPYNDNHIRLFKEFEETNNLRKTITSYLNDIRSTYTDKDKYDAEQKQLNETKYVVFSMENNAIKDSCFIRGERDIKICELYFSPLKEKNRQLLKDASNYALNRLGMEQIFVLISPNDKNMKINLESRGFENIGNVNGQLTFIKEKEDKKEVGRVK